MEIWLEIESGIKFLPDLSPDISNCGSDCLTEPMSGCLSSSEVQENSLTQSLNTSTLSHLARREQVSNYFSTRLSPNNFNSGSNQGNFHTFYFHHDIHESSFPVWKLSHGLPTSKTCSYNRSLSDILFKFLLVVKVSHLVMTACQASRLLWF